MLAFSHALTGAVIASKASNPILGYALAVISHPLLDLVPHWDFNTRCNGHRPISTTLLLSLTDAALGFTLGFFLFKSQVDLQVLLISMFLAQLPDWLESPYHVLNWKFPPFIWVKRFQHLCHWKLAFPWGFLTQILFLIFILNF